MSLRKRYRSTGTLLADGPICIWVVIMFLFLPLLDFGAVLLRTTFLYMAVHNAARSAARSTSFLNPVSGQPSATTVATNTVNSIIATWNGVTVNSIITDIVITNVNTLAISRTSNPLPTPPDDSNYTYQVEVNVTGSVDPLVKFNFPSSWFGSSGVPGLTKAMTVTMSDRQYFENPQGLIL